MTVIVLMLRSKKQKASFFAGATVARGCDAGGCGHFGAPRGTRTHQGFDILCTPGAEVLCPFDGFIARTVDPYGDGKFSGLKIKTLDFDMKIMYMKPYAGLIGEAVKKGTPIGMAQDVSTRYTGGVKPHLHIEIAVNGFNVDPEPYLF